MQIEEIIKITMGSPALEMISNKTGKFAYPERWQRKVPLKVKMNYTVVPDLPFLMPTADGTICIGGNEYYVWVNSYGAVSAILPNGERLGLKPDEFEVIEFHQK
jgi:hypothetical protein